MTATLEMPTAIIQTPLTLTEAAASEVKSLLAEQERDDLYLRVYVAGGGCSGLQYGMALDENIEPGDESLRTQRRPPGRGRHLPALRRRRGRGLHHHRHGRRLQDREPQRHQVLRLRLLLQRR